MLQQIKLGFLFAVLSSVALAYGEAASAFGRDDKWVSGWGQGVSEAIVTHGPGNQIYVTCNGGGNPYADTSISFLLGGNGPTGSSVALTFDNEDPEAIWISEGRISSDCRACAANYEYIVSKLKKHSSVHVMFDNGDAARFTLSGSAEAITACIPDFAR